MSSIQTLLTLSIIGAILLTLTWSYNDWMNKYPELAENAPGCEVSPDGKTVICDQDLGTDLANDPFAWYNIIWIIPLAAAIIYAWVPLVKG